MPTTDKLTAGIVTALEADLSALRNDWQVRKSVAQNYGQLLEELAQVKLPAAVIVPGSWSFAEDGLSATVTVALVLIDQFKASQPGRVAGVQDLLDDVIKHYHPVFDLGEHGYVRLGRGYATEVDDQYASLVQELTVDVPFGET